MSNGIDLKQILKEKFGYDSFLPGQEAILNDIFRRRHVVAIMPTGGGKSLIYQLPASVARGQAVVVSPLISLMKDQVDSLREKGLSAVYVNSTLSAEEKRQAYAEIRSGNVDLIYIAPERIRDRGFMNLLKEQNVTILAVDEAHCISQWGHDFRPDYMQIARLRRELGDPVTIAVTATATRKVREDIAAHLELENWADHIEGFDRENLFYRVTEIRTRDEKFDLILQGLSQMKGPAIIYAATRKNTELVADTLRMEGIPVLTYHGGMNDKDRTEAQERFMNGEITTVAATNAFGMGIDKPDIRMVAHFDIPGSLEAYYQEVGRAGRDGEQSLCHLLFSYADVRIQEFFIEESNPEPAEIRTALSILKEKEKRGDLIPDFGKQLGLKSAMSKSAILQIFTKGNYIEKDPDGEGYRYTGEKDCEEGIELLIKAACEKRAYDKDRLDKMVQYAYNMGCRRNWILDYFGDSREHGSCRACDNCVQPRTGKALEGEQLSSVISVLEGVSAMNGRMGIKKTIDFMRGSSAEWVGKFRYDLLPEYGNCSRMSDGEVRDIVNACIDGGLCQVRLKDGKYPLLSITADGIAVINGGECRIRLKEPPVLPRVKKVPPPSKRKRPKNPGSLKVDSGPVPDSGFFELLKEERAEIAKKKRIKSFQVLHNSTLSEIAAVLPETEEDLESINGIGPAKLKKYGEWILGSVKKYRAEKGKWSH